MFSSLVYFLRFVTIVAVVITCVGNSRINAQTTALVKVISVFKSIPAGTAFLERNGIHSSGSAAEILTQIQNFPPAETGVMATVLGEFGLRMGTDAPGNTLNARVALRRARERLAGDIFFINKGRPNEEPLEVARLAAKYAAYDHSGTIRNAAVTPLNTLQAQGALAREIFSPNHPSAEVERRAKKLPPATTSTQLRRPEVRPITKEL